MMTDIKENKADAKLLHMPELAGKILVDPATGQIYLSGSAVRLPSPALVIRHGETDGNLRMVLQGQSDGPENQLNQQGKEQAKHAADDVLAELEFRLGRAKLVNLSNTRDLVLLTSPIGRALQTCEYFVRGFEARLGLGIDIREEDALGEISFGRYDGYAIEEIPEPAFADLVLRYRCHQDATIDWFQTGESFIDAVIRARDLIERLNQSYREKLLIMFTHGTFISALRTALGDRSLASKTGMIHFRDRIIKTGSPHWLADSLSHLKNTGALGDLVD
jgi:broad specificity phosphatase PhoE